MAKGCWCDRMLARVTTDPVLVLAPLAARWVWLMLVRTLRDAPEPGVLRFPQSVSGSVSDPVSAQETQAVTQTETRCIARLVQLEEGQAAEGLLYLLAEGLLLRRPEDGALVLPEAEESGRRAAIARANGAKGGRPRKAPPDPRQREILMPLAGGKSETQETQMQTDPETLSRAQLLAAAREESKQLVALGDELAEVARLDPARGGYDYRPLQRWLSDGVQPDTIRAAVRRVAARPGYAVPRGFAYFDQAVREDQARARPASTLTPAQREHLEALKAWDGNGPVPKLREVAA